jgi:hypothetical protein
VITDIRPIVERLLRQLVLAGVPVLLAGCDAGHGPLEQGANGGRSGSIIAGGTGGAGTGGGAATGSGGGASGGTGGSGGGGGGASGATACVPLSFGCGPRQVCTALLTFDPADPRWADLYSACVATDPTARNCSADCGGFCAEVLRTRFPDRPGDGSDLTCEVACGSPPTVMVNYLNICGRRPRVAEGAGYDRGATACRRASLGDYLAGAAELEAASVPAFRRLAADLAAHRAPEPLVDAARAAIADEARHWRRTRALARRHGGCPVRPAIAAAPPASLAELAIDNVVEGCVRETYGALVAAHQATEAREPAVRELMADIAADERAHAALAWRIDAWVAPLLGPRFQPLRARAALAAVLELWAGTVGVAELSADVRGDAGLPARPVAEALLATGWSQLWGPALARGGSAA